MDLGKESINGVRFYYEKEKKFSSEVKVYKAFLFVKSINLKNFTKFILIWFYLQKIYISLFIIIYRASVAQWQSGCLVSSRSRVRIPPEALNFTFTKQKIK